MPSIGEKLIERVLVAITLACCALEVSLAQSADPSVPTKQVCGTGYVNVREAPYSAVGDGKTDDTKAIQSALDVAAAAGGGIVFVPSGTYLIKTHLIVRGGTSLVGVARAPARYTANSPGTTLLAVEGAGDAQGTPFVALRGPNSTLEGISVFYPKQVIADKPIPYPWTVRGGGEGENVSIINVHLVNPYQAVDLATEWSSRHYIRGLYAQVLFKGLWVDKCSDIGRIEDVHFVPFWTMDTRVTNFVMANATAFIFQRTDWEVVKDIFCWGYKTGIVFSASKDGGMNGQMTDVGLDAVDIGIDASFTKAEGIAISSLSIANGPEGTERVAIWARNGQQGAHLFIRGGSFWGYLNRIVKWEMPGTISLSESRIVPSPAKGPMIEILAGQAMIHDNSVAIYPGSRPPDPGTALYLGPGIESAVVHGNLLNGNRIVNEAGERAAIDSNRP